MKKESRFFKEKDVKIHYTVSGNGPKKLIVFHGFGQTESVFDELNLSFVEEYTIYCFDLFFHGKSSWLQTDLFTQKEWVIFFQLFLNKEKIDSFSLLTFSLGTRFGLSLYQNMPQKVAQIWLIAPEGLTIHWVYKLITGFKFTRFLFRYTVVYPHFFLNIIYALSRMRLIPLRGYRFLSMMMKTPEQRLQVYKTWIVLRKLVFNSSQVIKNLNKHQTSLTIFASKKDYIVPFLFIKKFIKKVTLFHLETYKVAHFRLIQEVTRFFQKQ